MEHYKNTGLVGDLNKSVYEKHILDMKILENTAELNRLNAEKDKIKELVKADRCNISLVKYETESIILESKLELKRKETELSEENYKLEIELPAELQADKIRRITNSRVERMKLETGAQVYSIKELGLAKIVEETSCKLAEASGFTKLAIALKHYYKALIIDRIAGYYLKEMAKKLKVDSSFRLKLERPISFLVELDEQQPVTNSWNKKFLLLNSKTKFTKKNRYILYNKNMHGCCIPIEHSQI